MKPEYTSPGTIAEDMVLCRAWSDPILSTPGNLPVSFRYGEKAIRGIPPQWSPASARRRIDANIVETIYEGTDPETGLRLRVECLTYQDYPVVEWTAWLSNTGNGPTPLISDVLALDAAFAGSSPVLYHCNGDFYSEDGYLPERDALQAGESRSFAPTGGRPCDGAFPYYRVQFEGRGLTLAVGWPAQWKAGFDATADGVHVRVGQELTHLRLLPGEKIRTPRVTLLSWTSDGTRAVNLWRRWYLEHVLPRPNGRPLQPKLVGAGTDEGEEFTAATEENQIRYMDAYRNKGFDLDVWWIDAGWYPCFTEQGERRWVRTGTWEPDSARFPRGFKPISDHATENGIDLLVWFEPERVMPGTWLANNHPEWLLRIADSDDWAAKSALLNLGIPECRSWLTDHVCKLIRENGIKIYRQDFNFPPLRHWRDNDSEERQGMHENLHVQGYLQFWDDLLARNPGLWIDSCSSGGRRNDLETMRRAVPLHYTDYGYGNHPVKLSFHHTLFEWIPYFKEVTLSWDMSEQGEQARFDPQVDSFSFHCGLGPMLFLTMDIRDEKYDFATAIKMVEVWRSAAGTMLHGDYYPLTDFGRSAEAWVAWQFDRPEMGDGFLQGIRHTECAQESLTVRPHVSRPDTDYVLTDAETGETRELSGAALRSGGFTFTLPRRAGTIWFYRAKV